jgi:predicted Zn-dependent protease
MRVFLLLAAISLQAQTQAQVEISNRAKALLAGNKFSEAAVLYTQLVQQIPNNPGLLLNQGMALHLSGDDAKAIPPLEAALKLNPNIPPALLFLGASYLRSGQPAKALPPLEKFAALDPANLEARQMLVDAATISGQPLRALPHLEKLGLWYDLGRTYEALAADTFTQLEKLFPESGPFFALLGDSRSKTSQRRAAFFFYRKALERNPNLRGLRTSIAEIYRASDRPDWALHEEAAEAKLPAVNCKLKTPECEFQASNYQSAIRLSKATSSALNLYWRTRSYNELAAEAFRKLPPNSPDYYRYQAETLRQQNQHAEAAEAWQAALRLVPDQPDFERELASTLLTLKDYEKAQQLATKLLAKEPAAPDLNHLQGDLFLAQQLPEKAEPFLQKAAKLDGRSLPIQASLARALLALGKAKEALPHVTKALPLDSDGSLHIQLARAYQSAGLSEEAKVAMAKYQQIQASLKQQDKVLEQEVQITPPN